MKLSGNFVSVKDIKPTRRRAITMVFAGQKAGKTHWALTAPDPIIYFGVEPGLEGVVENFPNKEIICAGVPDKNGGYPSYAFAKPAVKLNRSADYLEMVRLAATPVFEQLLSDWKMALNSDARTLVLDTASATYDLGRFAYLGLAGKAAAKDDPFGIKSSAVKALMRGLITDCYSAGKNVVVISREKQVWKANEPTDEFESDGWSGVPYEVQVVVRLTKKTFGGKTIRRLTVADSRLSGDYAQGLVFAEEEAKGVIAPMDYVSVMSNITNTDPAEWL